jgi:hypothetical protein
MNQEQADRLEKLRWENVRRTKQIQFDQRLKALINAQDYSFVPFADSDVIQLASDGWPTNKWEHELYLQVEIAECEKIAHVLEKFLHLSQQNFCYMFCLHYNFGFVKVDNKAILHNWAELIEIDGDQVFLHLPDESDFLSIEKTEDKIIGREDEGMKWIYEITYSNEKLKQQIEKNGT